VPDPLLYDAVTLRHFAAVGRLDILEERHAFRPGPHWTEAVHDEIVEAATLGLPGCHAILAASWLGEPLAPSANDLRPVLATQIGLNDGRRPPTQHAGEAESIYFADKLGGIFATDDNAAFEFAATRIGVARVVDTVGILREAVAMGEVTGRDAVATAEAIRAAGRQLRRLHPHPITEAYLTR
jgi:hypothetical protein